MNKWETLPDFPPACPPSEASAIESEIYVYVKSDPPRFYDFKCAYDKNIHSDQDACLRRAISCGIEIKYLENLKSLFPAAFGKKKMAVGVVAKDNGVLLKTCNNKLHYSYWISPEFRPDIHKYFKVIK